MHHFQSCFVRAGEIIRAPRVFPLCHLQYSTTYKQRNPLYLAQLLFQTSNISKVDIAHSVLLFAQLDMSDKISSSFLR